MALDNFVQIAGSLGADPELRYTLGGLQVATFSVAVFAGYEDDGNGGRGRGQGRRETKPPHWVDVVCFGQLAENACESLVKGDRVNVTGRFQQDKWEDKDTGQKRSKLKVVADDLGVGIKWTPAEPREVERQTPQDREQGTGGYVDGEEPF